MNSSHPASLDDPSVIPPPKIDDEPGQQDVQAVRSRSPYTTRQKAGRVLWGLAWLLLFRPSPRPVYRWRAGLLRLFGARLGRNVRVRPSVRIEIPWNLDLGDDVTIGDHAILYALGPIRIDDRSFVSQYGHLCAGTHDHTRPDYPLLRPPIHVGKDCWIAADAFVGPGVHIGDRALVGARASVFKDVPADVIVVGNPAKPVKPREFHQEPPQKDRGHPEAEDLAPST